MTTTTTTTTANDNSDAVLTVSELMARWKVRRQTVLGLIDAGKLRAFRIGNERSAYRVAMAEVLRVERGEAA